MSFVSLRCRFGGGKKNITQKKGKINIKWLLDVYLDGLAGLINLINREDTEDKSFRNSGRTHLKSFIGQFS